MESNRTTKQMVQRVGFTSLLSFSVQLVGSGLVTVRMRSKPMKPFIKAALIAIGAAAVFFFAEYVMAHYSGEPCILAKGVSICVIVFFAFRIAYKSEKLK